MAVVSTTTILPTKINNIREAQLVFQTKQHTLFKLFLSPHLGTHTPSGLMGDQVSGAKPLFSCDRFSASPSRFQSRSTQTTNTFIFNCEHKSVPHVGDVRVSRPNVNIVADVLPRPPAPLLEHTHTHTHKHMQKHTHTHTPAQ